MRQRATDLHCLCGDYMGSRQLRQRTAKDKRGTAWGKGRTAEDKGRTAWDKGLRGTMDCVGQTFAPKDSVGRRTVSDNGQFRPGHQHPELVSRRNLRFVRQDLLEHDRLDVAQYISCLPCAIAARTAWTARTAICFELKCYLQIVVVAVVVGKRTAWDGTEDCMGRWTALDKPLHQSIGQRQTTDSMGRRAAQDSGLLWTKDCAKTG